MIRVTCNNHDITSILQQQLPTEEEEDTSNDNKNNNNKVRLWTNTNSPPSTESKCVQFDCDNDNIIRNTKKKSLIKKNSGILYDTNYSQGGCITTSKEEKEETAATT